MSWKLPLTLTGALGEYSTHNFLFVSIKCSWNLHVFQFLPFEGYCKSIHCCVVKTLSLI